MGASPDFNSSSGLKAVKSHYFYCANGDATYTRIAVDTDAQRVELDIVAVSGGAAVRVANSARITLCLADLPTMASGSPCDAKMREDLAKDSNDDCKLKRRWVLATEWEDV